MNGEPVKSDARTEDTKLDPEIKAKWLAALRGGSYQQVRENLRIGNTFCCLGVLCDIYRPEGWDDDGILWTHQDQDEYEINWCDGDLSVTFMRLIGVTDEQQAKLIAMNDKEGASFAEIAAYIEANL